jgi:hypothetical protein
MLYSRRNAQTSRPPVVCTVVLLSHNAVTGMGTSTSYRNEFQKLVPFFFLVYWGGVRLSPLGTSATVGLLYQPRMIDDDECGVVGGMRIGKGNRSTRRKSAPVPLCPP